jgi:hypothetical protein
MNSKKILVLIIWLSLFTAFYTPNLIMPPVKGQDPDLIYTEQFSLEEGATHFVMTYLDINETWFVNCTAIYTGKFHLFLFDERPLGKNLLKDGTINDAIYTQAETYNVSPSLVFSDTLNDSVYSTTLSYTATERIDAKTNVSLYYLQIFCVDGGPDTYIMQSLNHEIQPYYIPFISAYPVGIISIMLIGSITFIVLRIRKTNSQ